jgi:hypothetical protein
VTWFDLVVGKKQKKEVVEDPVTVREGEAHIKNGFDCVRKQKGIVCAFICLFGDVKATRFRSNYNDLQENCE